MTTSNQADHGELSFDHWRDEATRAVIPLDYQCDTATRFSGHICAQSVGGIQLARLQATPHAVKRTTSIIQSAKENHVIFNWLISGNCLAKQDGNETQFGQQSMWICDASRYYDLEFPDQFELVSMALPKSRLGTYHTNFDSLTVTELNRQSEVTGFVQGHLTELVNHAPFVSSLMADRVAKATMEWVMMLLSEQWAAVGSRLSHSQMSIVMRVKQSIALWASNPELTGNDVAEHIGVSTRYINQLLNEEGMSLSRMIWLYRTQKAAEMLSDSQNLHRTISDIAYSTGFNDVAHFSRLFKKHFNVTPSQYRQHAERASTALEH